MPTVQAERQVDSSIIALDRFIQATRDSGYKGTGSAIAELVDNALEAGAKEVRIDIVPEPGANSLRIDVLDNGSGMDPVTLQQALRFGGSTRFDSRKGLGRYGMGLPNSSVSQARRVEVITWQDPSCAYTSYLDVDEITSGSMTSVPKPRKIPLPSVAIERAFLSGTIVTWVRCDRLDFRRVSSIADKLDHHVGRVFRYFLWSGVEILINSVPIRGVDPLFLNKRSRQSGATIFGSPLEFDIRIPLPDKPGEEIGGSVTATFSLLPVGKWHALTNDEKRDRGVAKGAGMSVVRAGREVDYGWWFFGDKRKENYDDWWRCELRFEPSLDEAFGITHTKQQIRPTHELLQALVPDIEATAKALNRKVREAHEQLKFVSGAKVAENLANLKERLLPALETKKKNDKKNDIDRLAKKYPHLLHSESKGADSHPKYSLIAESFRDKRFFHAYLSAGQLVVALNVEHPFYRRIYLPLSEASDNAQQRFKQQIDLMILAAARSELACKKHDANDFLLAWSNVLNTFLS